MRIHQTKYKLHDIYKYMHAEPTHTNPHTILFMWPGILVIIGQVQM